MNVKTDASEMQRTFPIDVYNVITKYKQFIPLPQALAMTSNS
jgi:hypothetical protein